MDITITEAALFVWGALATGYAIALADRLRVARLFSIALIEDPNFYKHVTQSVTTLKEATHGRRV